jgi:hypothetical protein
MDARTRRSCVAGSGRERGGVCVGRGGELTVVVRQLTHVRCPIPLARALEVSIAQLVVHDMVVTVYSEGF